MKHATTESLSGKYRVTESGCWEWLGYVNPNGYASMRVEGKRTTAHRAFYSLLVGPIPDGYHLDHLCRNRRCVNPEHLEPVTPAENNRRGAVVRHRPTEVRAVVALLEEEHDDVEALAQAILDRLLDIKWKRGAYIAIRRLRVEGDHPWPDFLAHGPYPTRKQAELDIGRRITAKSPGEYAYFALVTDLDATDQPDPDLWTLFDPEGEPDP